MNALPIELFYLVLDELRNDPRSLSNCSLVCKSWLLPCSAHLFKPLKVDITGELPASRLGIPIKKRRLSDFSAIIYSSSRMAGHLRSLTVHVWTDAVPTIAAVLVRLPQLERLSLWYTGRGPPPEAPATTLPCTNRHLDFFAISAIPADVLSYFLRLFATVDTLDMYACKWRPQACSARTHRVRCLKVRSTAAGTLRSIAEMLEPSGVESMQLGLSDFATPRRLRVLLQVVGQHIRHLELEPEGYAWEQWNGKRMLQACTNVESFTIVIPGWVASAKRLWPCTLALLSHLPPQTQQVRLVISFGISSPLWLEVRTDHALAVLRVLNWREVGRALGSCQTLRSLHVSARVLEGRKPVSLKECRDVHEEILAQLPLRLRLMAKFE